MIRRRKSYDAIDNFRLVAALLIVAIHTAPLKSFNETADFLVTYCFGRIGVPFFLMVTGFFVLAPYQRGRQSASGKIPQGMAKFLKKTTLLYAVATLLYLPLKIYSENISDSVGGWMKEIFFDGTFYHLWYLPAVILGCLLIIGLLQFCNPMAVSILVFVLYIFGVLGDSYYHLVSQIPFMKTTYEGIFAVSSYTRNGIFFAPLFLWMGVLIANGNVKMPRKQAGIGFAISLVGMLAEGFISFHFEWQKHNSMYFMLIPVMFFLFELLLDSDGIKLEIARDLSMYIYILHPFCIVLVRGLAGVLKMTKLLVEQSLIHYLAVVAVTVLLSLVIVEVKVIFQRHFSEPD